MAEEKLVLVDGMSPALKRIAEEAQRLNNRMQELKKNIQAKYKPNTLSAFKRDLKEAETGLKRVENQANKTREAIRLINVARSVGGPQRLLSWNYKQGTYWYHGPQGKQYISDADLARYGANIENGRMRRQALREASPRLVNGMTFDQRLAAKAGSPSSLSFVSGIKGFNVSLYSAIGYLWTFQYAVSSVTQALKSFVNPQDQYIGGVTRAALTADGKYRPTGIMNQLYDMAIRTRADSEGTVMLYNRLAMSGMKASNDRILRFVETFNKTMAISGTTAQENKAVMLQLAQGLGSNRLGGDEFRSIAEQAPMFKYMLAKGLGVNPGALKQMGADGKLTAEAVVGAMEKVQGMVDEVFKEAPWTIGQLLIVLGAKWQKVITQNFTGYVALRDVVRDFVGWLDTAQGSRFMQNTLKIINGVLIGTSKLARMISPFFVWLINNAERLAKIGVLVGVSWAFTRWVAGLTALSKAMGITTTVGALMWNTMAAGAMTFGEICFLVLGWIGAIIAAMTAAWIVGQKIADGIAERRNARALAFDEDMMQRGKEDAWQKYVAKQSSLGLTADRSKWEKDYWAPTEKKLRDSHQKWVNSLSPEQRALDELNASTNPFYGKMDSSKNIPMDVNKVKEVGKINESVTLSTESLQMMKAVAERQWIMQNEVTVPQKVDVTISQGDNLTADKLAEALVGGTQKAINASMRGAYAT